MLDRIKQKVLQNVKNLYGWKTKRKIVVISVDDYGNVRLDSKEARANLDKAGLKVNSRFDALDTLETKEDLCMLFDALESVKDKNGNSAVFTPFAMPCNIDFEGMAESGFEDYKYELLPITYQKLSANQPEAYTGAWELWKEGIGRKIMAPQFHGREHLNLKVFQEKLKNRNHEVLTALKNRSYTSISSSGYPTISFTAAFEFNDFSENEAFKDIINEGLQAFKDVYGYSSIHFNPPGGREHPVIHGFLKDNGVKYLDTPWIKNEHEGSGKFKRIINYTGKVNAIGQIYMVRNIVFEPTENRGLDWVNFALYQVEAAFRWNRPAIISSHRVNFCGHIDPQNRKNGTESLKQLLKKIVAKWPDVEFMSSVEFADIMAEDILK